MKTSAYGSYRYGTTRKSKVYQPGKAIDAVVGADKRRALVQKVGDILNGSSWSKFEFEATCRHGLRQGWCLDGNSWTAADEAAKAIVAQALSSIGAKRPTWEEGQPEYTAPTDCCLNCSGPLDDESIARRAKFCSRECATALLLHRGQSRESQQRHIIQVARRIVKSSNREVKICECCGKEYRSLSFDDRAAVAQKFCSRKCRAQARRTIPARNCEGCGKEFRPGSAGQVGKFCSNACYHSSARPEHSVVCAYCGVGFVTTRPGGLASFCTERCYQSERRLRSGAVPKSLLPHVFDRFFTKPVNARPAWLTPERFDEMLAV